MKSISESFAKFTGKQLCRSFFKKVVGLQPATVLRNARSPKNFKKCSGMVFLGEHLRATISM